MIIMFWCFQSPFQVRLCWRVFSKLLPWWSVKYYCTLVFQWQRHGVPKFAQQIPHFSHVPVKNHKEDVCLHLGWSVWEQQSEYLSIFSISVPTSHCSCRNSMGEEDCSSRMGTSELSSILKSTFGSESVPWGTEAIPSTVNDNKLSCYYKLDLLLKSKCSNIENDSKLNVVKHQQLHLKSFALPNRVRTPLPCTQCIP